MEKVSLEECEFVAQDISGLAFTEMENLFNARQLCDITLQVGKRRINAHRVVLASISPYFRAMFTNKMSESDKSVVTIKGVDEDSLLNVIKFVYSHRMTIGVDNVQNLLQCSSMLQIESVVGACCDFISKHLSISNCLSVHNFVEAHGCSKLVCEVNNFVKLHFLEIMKRTEFLDINVEHFKKILCDSDLNVSKEEEVFECIIKWVQHSSDTREQYVDSLLQHVRLPMLPVEYLINKIETEKLVSQNLACRDLIDEAKNFHLCPDIVSQTPRISPRKSYSGVLLSIGGRGKNGDPFSKIEIYDWLQDSWTSGPRLLMPRRHVATAVVDGKIYAVGGHNGSEHLNTVECFDPAAGKWELCQPMDTCRRGMSIGILKGMLYAVGGLDESTCFNRVERYDPKAGVWTEVASMKIQRGGVAAIGFRDYLYAAGGNNGGSSLASVERYDPHRNCWTEVTPMTQQRAGLGIAALNGHIFVIGGFDDSLPLKSAEKYNPKTNTWSPISDMKCCRGGVGVCAMGRMLWAVGGHDGTTYLNSVEFYDVQTDTWQFVAPMETGRAGSGVVSCKYNPMVTTNAGGMADSAGMV